MSAQFLAERAHVVLQEEGDGNPDCVHCGHTLDDDTTILWLSEQYDVMERFDPECHLCLRWRAGVDLVSHGNHGCVLDPREQKGTDDV